MGMTKDENTGLYYYGARYFDPRISLWHGVDPLAEDYPGWSTFAYTMNNPITYWDPTGMNTEDGGDGDPPKGIIVLFYSSGGGSNSFKAAAETRRNDIEGDLNFDPNETLVLVRDFSDISDVGDEMKKIIETFGEKFGKTSEVSFFAHSGVDGPRGDESAKEHPLSPGKKQMSLEGWSKINFNWSKDSECNFFGCNTANESEKSFSKNVSKLPNFSSTVVSGQPDYSYPSTSPNFRLTSFTSSIGIFDFGKTYFVSDRKDKSLSAMWFYPGSLTKAIPMNSYYRGRNINK